VSLRHGATPWKSKLQVTETLRLIHPIAKSWMYVASVAGSCALNGKGNDLDLILVPFWNDPTGPYPVNLGDSVYHMIDQIAEVVGGTMPDQYMGADGYEIACQVDYYSGIILTLIWLPDGRTIDIKTWPGVYVREDIRKALGLNYAKNADVHGRLWPFPKRDSPIDDD
jgi:hypothetical protein